MSVCLTVCLAHTLHFFPRNQQLVATVTVSPGNTAVATTQGMHKPTAAEVNVR